MQQRILLLVSVLTLIEITGCLKSQVAQLPSSSATAHAAPAPVVPTSSTEPVANWGCVYQGEGAVYWLAPGAASPVKLCSLAADDTVGSSDISPDGTRLAIITGNGTGEILDVAKGSVQTVLFSGDNLAAGLAWSPDASGLAYVNGGKLYVRRGGTKTLLVSDKRVTDIAWSPDGKQIAYGRRDATDKDLGLFVVSASGGKPRQLAKGTRDVFGVASLAWSPDGKTIAFLHSWEGGALCFIKADGTGYRPDVGPAFGDLTWLQDSSAVVYPAMENEVETLGIFRCTPAGKPEAIVRNKNASYDMLPSGLLLSCEGSGDDSRPVAWNIRPTPSKSAAVGWSGAIKGSDYADGSLCPDGNAVALLARDDKGDGILWLAHPGEEPARAASKVERILGWVKR
jgi:hypothetical protein